MYANLERKDWLDVHKTGIGGSDVAAVLGISPWKSPLDVFLDKTGKSAPEPENDAMYWGTRLEALVANKYCEVSGNEVRRVNSILRSEKFPCLIGNIDRAVCPEKGKLPVVKGVFRTPKILECKTARSMSDEWGANGTDQIPEYYLTQVLHYLGLTGCESCDVACLFLDSRKFGIYTVYADSDLIATMFARLAQWWDDYVAKNVAPPARSIADVQKLFKRSAAVEITATKEIEDAAFEYASLKKQEAEIAAKLESAKEKIAVYMGEADTLVDVGGKPLITWKTGKDKSRTDWQKVAKVAGATEAMIAANTTTCAGNRTFLSKIKLS